MPRLSELHGLWRREFIAWPDGRVDRTSSVQWLQGLAAFGDLRQPAPPADFSHAGCVADLSRSDCEYLSQQQGFAGYLTVSGNYFEWKRLIDFQPAAPHADAGSLRWEGDLLIEEGRDVSYVEHWRPDSAVDTYAPLAGAVWRHLTQGIRAIVVRAGARLMYARERRIALPKRSTLSECLAQADGIEQVRAMVDCEISFAAAAVSGFRIYASTLPFRVGESLQGPMPGEWHLETSEGSISDLGRD